MRTCRDLAQKVEPLLQAAEQQKNRAYAVATWIRGDLPNRIAVVILEKLILKDHQTQQLLWTQIVKPFLPIPLASLLAASINQSCQWSGSRGQEIWQAGYTALQPSELAGDDVVRSLWLSYALSANFKLASPYDSKSLKLAYRNSIEKAVVGGATSATHLDKRPLNFSDMVLFAVLALAKNDDQAWQNLFVYSHSAESKINKIGKLLISKRSLYTDAQFLLVSEQVLSRIAISVENRDALTTKRTSILKKLNDTTKHAAENQLLAKQDHLIAQKKQHSIVLLSYQAEHLFEQAKFAAAYAAYQKVLDLDPKYIVALDEQAGCLFEQKQFAAAYAAYQKGIGSRS